MARTSPRTSPRLQAKQKQTAAVEAAATVAPVAAEEAVVAAPAENENDNNNEVIQELSIGTKVSKLFENGKRYRGTVTDVGDLEGGNESAYQVLFSDKQYEVWSHTQLVENLGSEIVQIITSPSNSARANKRVRVSSSEDSSSNDEEEEYTSSEEEEEAIAIPRQGPYRLNRTPGKNYSYPYATCTRFYILKRLIQDEHMLRCFICNQNMNVLEYVIVVTCHPEKGIYIYGYPSNVKTVKIHLHCFTQIATLRKGFVVESHVNLLKSGLVRVLDADGKRLIPLCTVQAEYDKAEKVLRKHFYADKEYCSNIPKCTLEEYVHTGDQIWDESDDDDDVSLGDGDEPDATEDVAMGSNIYPPEKVSKLTLDNGTQVEFVGKLIQKRNKEDDNIYYCTFGKVKGACFGYHVPKNIADVTNEDLDCYQLHCSKCPPRTSNKYKMYMCKPCNKPYKREHAEHRCNHKEPIEETPTIIEEYVVDMTDKDLRLVLKAMVTSPGSILHDLLKKNTLFDIGCSAVSKNDRLHMKLGHQQNKNKKNQMLFCRLIKSNHFISAHAIAITFQNVEIADDVDPKYAAEKWLYQEFIHENYGICISLPYLFGQAVSNKSNGGNFKLYIIGASLRNNFETKYSLTMGRTSSQREAEAYEALVASETREMNRATHDNVLELLSLMKQQTCVRNDNSNGNDADDDGVDDADESSVSDMTN